MKCWLATLLFAGYWAVSCSAMAPAVGRAADGPNYDRTEDVIYGRKHGMALTLDVFKPRAKANGAGVVFVVSGGWFSGHDRIPTGAFSELLNRGYTVFAVVHGSQPRFTIPEAVADIGRAVRFIRAHAADYPIDPGRIGITGGSAGGHLSLMQGMAGDLGKADADDPIERVSSRVQAVACLYPPTDFLNYGEPGKIALGRGTLSDYRAPFDFNEFRPETKRFERIDDEARVLEIGRSISPVSHVSADDPPTLIVHGDADKLVPIQQAELIIDKLNAAGVAAELAAVAGGDHGGPAFTERLPLLADWFDKYLMPARAAEPTQKPNIVYILADDLGYGDVRCLNPDGKIATPNMDRLAAAGMIFTDAHSGSSVCTPSRYGILTGRYAWRSRLQQGVQGGHSPRLIEPGRLTVAALLKQHGYHTAAFGKWHLGMNWPLKPAAPKFGDGIENGADGWNVDFTRAIAEGPNSVGFDHYFGISASLDMVPYTFIENDRVTIVPTVDKQFPMMLGREGGATRKGPAAADFEAIDVLPTLTAKAVESIGRRAAEANSGRPFFLYLPLASPHTPIAPTGSWRGKSAINPYADFVMQTDAALGEVIEALDRHGLAENTLVIFTSDNGCSPMAKFDELLAQGHNPNDVFRGHKADIFEGGHRVPFIVRWPTKVKPGTKSDQTICLTDLMATCAELLGAKLPDDAGEDSVSLLPALLGQAVAPLREAVVHHSVNGSFAIRQGKWKLALCPDSGGWSKPTPGSVEASELPAVQLYDLAADIGERNNVQGEHPQVVARLTKLLERYVAEGRSTPGSRRKNTRQVDIGRAVKATRKPAKQSYRKSGM
ncbi:MAG TPA: sulfatase-like hydrolase/transferase [Pirellulales bacterium]|nr:sulfatase-like hydrolase/transferase [Pirellulales bacterium]